MTSPTNPYGVYAELHVLGAVLDGDVETAEVRLSGFLSNELRSFDTALKLASDLVARQLRRIASGTTGG